MENRIIDLFEASGMSIREFATRADLKYTTAHDIVTGKSNVEKIGAGSFVRIAHALGTTADALLDGYAQVDSSLSKDERELIDLFRASNAEGRSRMLEQAVFLQSRHPLNKGVSMRTA